MSKITTMPPEGTGELTEAASLVHLLRARAQATPDRLVYTFLTDGDAEEEHLTYGQLDARARAVAGWLQRAGARGRRVLLLYPPGLDYNAAFWGCLYAGAVAVPAYPPRLNRSLLRLRSIVADARASVALTTPAILSRLEQLCEQAPELSALRWGSVAEPGDGDGREDWEMTDVSAETLAFLQYTSGSTAAPKGVMVTHGNLLRNEELIRRAFGQTEESVIVGWLPVYHDMGLIGNVLQPVYVGARCVLMSPAAFLQQPARWLRAISRYGATTSGGPNFAYDLCARKVGEEERARLDLSSWTVAFNGAEPVRAETLERFATAFAACGFRREAFRPCYGLAESTLLVTASAAGRAPSVLEVSRDELERNVAVEASGGVEETRRLVGCGAAGEGHEVIVVNPETLRPCAAGEVGEIWVGGPSVAGGYWGRPDETAHTFHAHLADESRGAYLRTGDLGFDAGGELFITGRLKDLIIIRGRNLYAHDVERATEESHPSLRPGCGAAFSVEEGGEERLIVVQEVERRASAGHDELIEGVRRALAEEFEVQPGAVVLVKPGGVPKTSSGKVQRRAAREMFLAGQFEPLGLWRATEFEGTGVTDAEGAGARADAGDVEGCLRAELAARLGVAAERIDADKSVIGYGLDSLQAVELAHSIESRFGVAFPVAELLGGESLSELAARVRLLLAEAAPPVAVEETDAAETHALSHGQEALWFLHRVAPDSAAYNVTAAARVRGPLDAGVLRESFRELVARHPSLRTTFEAREGVPVRRVNEHAQFLYEELDAANLDEPALRELLAERAHRPFDLSAGPLFRVSLLRRADDEHVLLLAAHHIVIDFWSLAVLVSELGAFYDAGRRGERAALPPPAGRYEDYVRRQRRALEGAEGARLWDYWRERLGGELPVLDLPTDRPRPPVQTFSGASHAARLDAGLARRLKALERESGATLHTLLLTAFQVLLSRHTGQDDVVVGSPAAGRGRAADAGVVGYFVNPLVLRADLSGDPTFEELLAQVRRTALDAFAHQDYPFPLLVQRLQPERDQSRSPLFQAMFVLQQTAALRLEGVAAFALGEEGARMRVGGLNLESVALEHRVAQFDLSLAAAEAGDEILVSWEYNTDLFDAATVERMAGRFETLLRGVVDDPGRRLSQLPLLTDAEERRLLVEWNDTAADYPRGQCLHQLFEEQAERTPEAVALVFGEERLTYTELDRRAGHLANYLRALGVGPEALVGVMMERSSELVVALLGVLKAGGAYVPLDPAYPAERLGFILEDARVRVLLTQDGLVAELPAHGAQVVRLDADWPLVESAGDARPLSSSADDNLAYVIYTSGSTGRPKGVAIAHASAVTMVRWALDTFTAEELEGVLASTSILFDLSVFELFVTLGAGGKVILADNALALPGLPAAAEVRLVNTVPSAMTELVRLGGVPDTVLAVNLAGEPLPRKLVEQIYERTSARRVLNLYGPSEDTTYSTFDVVASEGGGRVTIGRPIANTQAYLLDASRQPVPVGVAGELYLSGAGLARGYLRRPSLTAERFVPDPFSQEPGARMYRTGDLARYLEDGRMEYLGRADFQVKLRGFRIELGEIETALAQHPSARECLVAARAAEGGEMRLVAYVLREPDAAVPSTSELRRFLAAKLPDYMIPSAFVQLDEWPLTPNGKIDRRALPAPTPLRPELEASFVAPRDQSEELLASIFAAVLGVERVGSDDNFFDLGGHSLLATQVIARIRDAFLVELPLRDFFRTPTVAGVARELARSLGANVPRPEPIVPAERTGGPPPLSFAQQRLWFLDQLERGSTAYNIPVAIRLRGRLDARALERGLGEIVNRHEALRTTFAEEGGEPVQVIAPPGPWTLPVEEVSDEGEALRRAEAEARERFDLARGPLVRARLLRVAAEHHVLLLTMHHIVSDGWSIGVLVRELVALYEAFSAGQPSPLAPLPVQYADYVQWQRARLGGEVLEAQLAYWRKQLGGELPVLDLPSDRPAHATRTHQAAAELWKLAPELGEGLRALGRRYNATLYMTLLAAFQSLLSRYTEVEDVAVGTSVAGRLRVEAEGLIGDFVNMLVMRGDLSGDPTFAELLERTREVTLEAHAHQEVPYEMLVEELRPERDLNRAQLFQVMLVLQNAPLPALRLGPLSVEQIEAGVGAAKFDLILYVHEEDDRIGGTWEFDTDRFDAATIRRMAGHFETLLRGLVEDPARRLSQLPLLTDAEERRLLVEWNDTRSEYPRDACVHQLFERQAASTPEAVALVFGEERLTYAELNARSNQLAHHLRALGVGPEVIVGLCVERSIEMVVGLLGILKAGGAYLPLDPAYPLERLSFMMEDAAVSVLLTQERLEAMLPTHWGHTLFLDGDWETVAAESAENVGASCAPDNLAYVMYTSGSTGVPKGVAVPHRAVVRLVRGTDYAEFGPAETFLQLAPASFDASTFEVWGALLHGARLAVMPPGAHSPEELAAALARHGVTTLWLTAGLFHQMVDAQAEALRGLRQLLAGGDVLSPSHVARVLEGGAGCVLINGYGPTENTTFTSAHRMEAGWRLTGASVPVGRPIANTRAYVLDAGMRPAPVGVAGELYAGGDGLARGYLSRPGLTAERFIPDPFGEEPGGRLYRTGDRVRWLGDGTIEFLGRSDGQVKVRGFRIEPGEIEAALGTHQLAREVAVVLREDAPGDKRVVAYVACDDPEAASQTDWRGFLRQRLPEYMIPSAFVCLRQLPLTPNGKLDRRALPAPEFQRDGAAHARLAPRTPVEAALLDIWRDLLHVARPGLDDNFFDLGGHSLMATQVLSRVRDLFGVEMPLRVIFEEPTPAGLAAHVESLLAGGVRPAAPPLEPTARDAALPLSFAQQRLWIMDQLEPGNPRYNLTHALRLRGSLDAAALERSIEEIVRRHETLRTTFAVVGRTPAQVIHPDATVKPDFVDLGHLPAAERESEARRLADAQALQRFDLAAGPLLRVGLLRLGAAEHVFVLTIHHIISDGWSIGVWVNELTALYNSYSRGLPASLPTLPIQYADFAKWQHELVEGGALSEQLAYWKRQLADAPPPLELPFDRERPARPTFGGATLDFELPAATYNALQELSRREGVTLYMALLAGFKALLHRYTGREDVTVGAAIANRNQPGVEGLIGFFVNMLVMRTDLSGDPTFRGLLARVRETALGAYAHQDVPFDTLVSALRVERQGAVNPLFQTLFILQNAPLEALELTGLTLTNFEVTNPLAHLDLIFSLQETDGRLAGIIQYSTELFDEETVARLLSGYREILEVVAADPEKRLSELGVSAAAADDDFTLRDLPEVRLNREQLASLLQDFDEP